mmetsp:Transcript_80181/g.235881  ORF Transcript_80181/g.235881 Transcript_80181/m.235881 type:complete len:380 (-) Transcript_80181:26-1165(-)
MALCRSTGPCHDGRHVSVGHGPKHVGEVLLVVLLSAQLDALVSNESSLLEAPHVHVRCCDLAQGTGLALLVADGRADVPGLLDVRPPIGQVVVRKASLSELAQSHGLRALVHGALEELHGLARHLLRLAGLAHGLAHVADQEHARADLGGVIAALVDAEDLVRGAEGVLVLLHAEVDFHGSLQSSGLTQLLVDLLEDGHGLLRNLQGLLLLLRREVHLGGGAQHGRLPGLAASLREHAGRLLCDLQRLAELAQLQAHLGQGVRDGRLELCIAALAKHLHSLLCNLLGVIQLAHAQVDLRDDQQRKDLALRVLLLAGRLEGLPSRRHGLGILIGGNEGQALLGPGRALVRDLVEDQRHSAGKCCCHAERTTGGGPTRGHP